MTEEERSERLRQEEEPTVEGEPGRGQGMVQGGDTGQGMVGKLDRAVDRIAETMTADSRPGDPIEGRGTAPEAPATPESGEGSTVRLDRDEERRMHVGEEVAVRLPEQERSAGWTYEVEGDARVLDISERARMITLEGRSTRPPGASGGSQFLLRAERRGRATVRFESLGQDATGPLHLKVDVKR
jgi:hypothetical protein